MRNDYFIMIMALSMASVLILYYGSYSGNRYIYDTANNLQRRIDKKLRDTLPACCKALTKECLSCAAGLVVRDFCERHGGEYGCPVNKTKVPAIPSHKATTIPIRQKYKHLGCIEKKVDIYADVISTALKYNIRLFPRNGFLLGIVRHKGYLPHEKIDSDMAMFESDFKTDKMIGRFGTYTLQITKQHLSWSQTWDGIHPKTGRKLPSGVDLYIDGEKWKTISLFFDLT
mgnify:CR=1 FL=1